MPEVDMNTTQIKLLQARATRFLQYQQQKNLSSEHGLLEEDLDLCLALGVLKHGYDEELPGNLSGSVFNPFNKCLLICMQNGLGRSKEICEVCDCIADLTKHSAVCMGHPEVCPSCKSFFNLLEYHMTTCYTCDMHLCTKLKLKLLKYHSTVIGGLVELWPKIQQYVSRLFPASVTIIPNCAVNKQGLARYPSIFDSGTPPASPALIARGLEQEPYTAFPPGHVTTTPFHHNETREFAGGQGNAATLGAVGGYHYYDEYMIGMAGLEQNIQGIGLTTPAPPGYNPFEQQLPPIGKDLSNTMSTDMLMSDLNSLPSLSSKLKMSDGCGKVIMGEPRQLRKLAEYWETLKERLQNAGETTFRTETDGVILEGTDSGMRTYNGQYKKNVQWSKVTFVGRGVAGKCFLAVDLQTEAQFAVKRIDLLKYNYEELEHWSELEHPNLVQLYGAMRVKKKIYIFSEFYAAGNVAEFIDGQKMLDQWLSLYFLQQLLDALDYLKKKGVLHEDIKADNIFLKPDSFKIGLGDFGLARKGRCPPNTKPVGGQHHWSPEKAKSAGHGYPADVWAAHCTFIHMLSGDPPWRRRYSDIVYLHYKIADESPPIEDIPYNLLVIVEDLIKKALTVDPNVRPTAEDLLQHDCFDLLSQADHSNPVFRSHIPEEGEDDIGMETYESNNTNLSIDSLLEGMEEKQQAQEYLEQIMATLSDEAGAGDSQAFGATGGASSSVQMRRQPSVRKQPAMESIRELDLEEMEQSLDSGDISLNLENSGANRPRTQGLHDRREAAPAIGPLYLPKKPAEKRLSWGTTRSNTSPSVYTAEEELDMKRAMLKKRETSPALIISPPNDFDADLAGEKSIFDLPDTSGYATAGPFYRSDDASLNFTSASSSFPQPLSSSYLDPMSSSWVDHSSNMWASAQDHFSHQPYVEPAGSPGVELRMNQISLNVDPKLANSGPALEEKFDLSSSLKMIKDTLGPPSQGNSQKSILTIVNGLSQLDQTEVFIRGNELWREVVELNKDKIKDWNIDGYTYYCSDGAEIALDWTVPKDKTDVFIFPTKPESTWQVRNGRITYKD